MGGQMEEADLKWYCFQAQPKREHIAAEILHNEMGRDVFCPRIRYLKATKRGKVHWVEPLFPGYVFVRCALQTDQRRIVATRGIVRIVAFGDNIPVLSDEVIAAMERQLVEIQAELDHEDVDVQEEVVVTEGPLRNMRAMVLGTIPARERVRILLDFLGRQVMTEVPLRAVMRSGARGAPKD